MQINISKIYVYNTILIRFGSVDLSSCLMETLPKMGINNFE